ncbi:ABC transporter ATP-binding protein [Hutsoniella sourekii]|uniref:ABC transporter ATP-binding protein n=1 Tax=Hutsoniella sourekii TaxID=87650 RepID=UPI00047F7C71|nr:ABC transporter ATP-binding protein [Hutsoniella sourekii]
MQTLLKAQQVNKYFDQASSRIHVLQDVSVDIQAQEFIAIMGPSGSGKSTLLFALSGMDKIDSGDICFQGNDLNDLSDEELARIRRQEMGFVFQQPTFIQQLSIIDNIMLPCYNDYSGDKNQLYSKAQQLMQRVGIMGLEQRMVHEVSGGQLQRAAICRAILHQPALLFADEPTGALNSQSSQEVLTLFEVLNLEGMAILLVTHDPNVAARAKRILFMKDGQLETDLRFDQEETTDKFQAVLDKMAKLGI